MKKLLALLSIMFLFSFTQKGAKKEYWALVLDMKEWAQIKGELMTKNDSISKRVVDLIDKKLIPVK